MGLPPEDIYWRSFALGAANELLDNIDYGKTVQFVPAAVINALPVTKVVDGLSVKLDAEKAKDTTLAVGFSFTDEDIHCVLRIRRGVAVFEEPLIGEVAATITTTVETIHEFIAGKTTLPKAVADGQITIDGDEDKVHELFGYFDPPTTEHVKVVTR